MEYIIFCICSVVIARYVEKKSRIVAIAHDILFILLSFAFFFASNNPTISSIVLRIVNKDIYNTVHNALVQSSYFIRGGFSVFFIIEGSICLIAAIASIIIFIKSLKELAKKIRIKTLNDVKLVVRYIVKDEKPSVYNIHNNEYKYLLNCKLQN